MKRDPAALTHGVYDLVIVGGGIYGICAAWDAALRGLSVAIIDRGDFCSATSANPLKLVHGGFRYLQGADLRRMRESAVEQKILMRIAPQLVYPIPFLIPTYGRRMQGKGILAVGLYVYNLLTLDRYWGVKDPQRRIPWGEVISKEECLPLFPGLEQRGLTGGVIFYDGQMYHPPRLAFSFLKSAVRAGAEAGNYLLVTGFLRDRHRVTGVNVRDVLTGDALEIRGKMVVNATGPWTEQVLGHLGVSRLSPPLRYSKDLYLVVHRPLSKRYALAMPSRHTNPNAIVSRGRRHFFFIPWREHMLIGSSHQVYAGTPDEYAVTEKDIQDLIDEVNACYPAADLTRGDVSFCNAGLVPMDEHVPGSGEVRLSTRCRLIDHESIDGVPGLVSVVGVRYTTARLVAQQTIDLVFRRLGYKPPKAMTAVMPLYGGRIERFGEFSRQESARCPYRLSPDVMDHLLHHHGSAYPEVLRYLDGSLDLRETLGTSPVIKAEVVHAVRAEMAQKLGDVVFRRTDLGAAGDPGDPALRTCAALMAAELGWDASRMRKELDEVRTAFP